MERIANFVYDRPKLIIVVVVIINVAALASFFRFNLNTDFLGFFTQGNPRAEVYHQLNQKYQTGEAISVLIEHDDSLLIKDNMKAVFKLQQEIGMIDDVALVQSYIPPEIIISGKIVSVDEAFIESNHQELAEFIQNNYFLTDQFLASGGESGLIIANLEVETEAREIIDSLQKIIQGEGGLALSLAGNEVIKDTLWDYLVRVLFILPPSAILLVLLVFYSSLRKLRFALMALIPAGFAALWTFGTIFWSGQELNIASVISPIFVIVMGAADGIHYLSHFKDNLGRYSDRRQLTIATLKMVGMPIFLTTITTMAGFASLIWTDVIPMRHMGIFVTLGIGYAGLLSIFFLPALLSRIKLPAKTPDAKQSLVNRFVLVVSKRRALIALVFLVVAVVSSVYLPRLEVVSNQLMFFKEDSTIRQTFARVEEQFGGAIPLTGEIVAKEGSASVVNYDFASRILAIERELERLPGIGSAFSIFDLVLGINKMTTGQDTYPQNPIMIQAIMAQISNEDKAAWISTDGFRVMMRTEGLATGDIEELDEFVSQNDDTIRMITGLPVLFSEMNNLVVRSQAQSLGLAIILIFLMLLITFRSFSAALVGLLPIAITILAIMGMLAITGFNLNIMTATLSAIAIGVGVDYSIHLISGIYYFRQYGGSFKESVNSALESVSRPILANAFGLAIGLSALFFSPLLIHTHVASVMWVAMVVSSFAALFLIPIFYVGRHGVVKKQ
ncbi:MAG: RND family transporter [Dehalococcoidia bacterium]|nr:MAG: RND family transporter [Dehalococcoidia bacterium]